MSHDELPPTEEELREAAALCAALDGDDARHPSVADAVEVVAMLHSTRQGAALDEVTHEAVLKRVLPGASKKEARRSNTARRVVVWVGLGSAVAAAAMLMVLRPQVPATLSREAPPVPSAAAAPSGGAAVRGGAVASAPSPELLNALASVHLGMTNAEVSVVGREAGIYRHSLLGAADTGGEP